MSVRLAEARELRPGDRFTTDSYGRSGWRTAKTVEQVTVDGWDYVDIDDSVRVQRVNANSRVLIDR